MRDPPGECRPCSHAPSRPRPSGRFVGQEQKSRETSGGNGTVQSPGGLFTFSSLIGILHAA